MCYNVFKPKVCVPEGRTVTIEGPVVGTAGLVKTGAGTLVIKDWSQLSGSVTATEGLLPRNVYITPEADGTGDGSSWASPMRLTDYLETAANRSSGDRVLLKAGDYAARIAQQTLGNQNIAFEGGYAGTDGETLDAENPVSVIDFGDYPTSRPFIPVKVSAASGVTVSFSRIRFQHARSAAIAKEGGGTLVLADCSIVSNGWHQSSDPNAGSSTGGRGIHAKGGLLCATNCAWIANMNVRHRNWGKNNIAFGGALNVNISSTDGEVDVANCTFAYNATDSDEASPAMDVWKGVVNVRNSIFAGNHKMSGNTAGADIMVRTGAVVNVSHTLLPGTGAWNAVSETIGEDAGTLNLGDGVLCGDALLASGTLASTNLVVSTKSGSMPVVYYDTERLGEVLAFDVHLRSRTGRWTPSGCVKDRERSPAIDAGDPASTYRGEPEPNGQRINLRRYGGTAEASLSRSGGLQLVVR